MGQPSSRAPVLAVLAVILLNSMGPDGQEPFRSGVVLVNVTATVTDRSGRFVAGLQQSDFVVYEDDQPVEITHFTAERVPVSLGIVLDTSGSESSPATPVGPSSQKGAARDLRRDRYEQRHEVADAEAVDPRVRSTGVRNRNRCTDDVDAFRWQPT